MFPSIRPLLFPEFKQCAGSDTSEGGRVSSEQPESLDSLTGFPESHKGEVAEQEARNLIDSIATVAMESAAAKYGQAAVEEVTDMSVITDGPEIVDNPRELHTGNSSADKTEKPMGKKVRHATDRTMSILSDITDFYERSSK